jgi:hypothetical protein
MQKGSLPGTDAGQILETREIEVVASVPPQR